MIFLFSDVTAPEGPDLVPDPLPDGEQATYTYEVRRDNTLVAAFIAPECDESTHPRLGAGTMDVRWSAAVDDDSDPLEQAAPHLFDRSAKKWATWDRDRIELWQRRQGAVVFQGPVTRHVYDARPDTVTTTARSRWRHVERVTLGMKPRLNHLFVGYFDAALTGWTDGPGATATAVTTPLWRGDRSMRVEASTLIGAPSTTAQATFATVGSRNYVDVSMQAMLQRGADIPFGVAAATVEHSTSLDGAAWAIQTTERLTFPDGYEAGSWERLRKRMPQWGGVQNRYRLDVHGATHVGWAGSGTPPALIVGEAEVFRDDNVSALEGQDVGVFFAALCDELVDILNEAGGPRWGRHVEPLGMTLHSARRELLRDHADPRAMLEEAVRSGLCDAYVPLGTRTITVVPRRGAVAPVLTVDAAEVEGLTVEVDAEEAVTGLALLSDGQDEPTREEGLSRAVAPPGAVLHRVDHAQPGTLPIDLDVEADMARAATGGAKVTVRFTPAVGPDGEDDPDESPFKGHPGAWVHDGLPGSTVRLELTTGLLAGWAVEPRLEEVRLRPLSDTIDVEPASVHEVVEG